MGMYTRMRAELENWEQTAALNQAYGIKVNVSVTFKYNGC